MILGNFWWILFNFLRFDFQFWWIFGQFWSDFRSISVKFPWNLVEFSFWIWFDILVDFWWIFGQIFLEFWSNFPSISVKFSLNFGQIFLKFSLKFGGIFLLNLVWHFGGFLVNFGQIFPQFPLKFDGIFPLNWGGSSGGFSSTFPPTFLWEISVISATIWSNFRLEIFPKFQHEDGGRSKFKRRRRRIKNPVRIWRN